MRMQDAHCTAQQLDVYNSTSCDGDAFEKKSQDHTFRRQFHNKPGNTPGCGDTFAYLQGDWQRQPWQQWQDRWPPPLEAALQPPLQ